MSPSNPTPDRWSYEEAIASVEEIIDQIESGSLPLEEVFDRFAVAVERLKECETYLERGKERMELAIETLSEPDF